MDFTFGIITNDVENINFIIDSVEKQNISNYEIIIIGNINVERENVITISFDETIKPMWITKKKNLITQNAKYENIVYMHDYVYLDDNWYNGYLKYGDNFKACMNIILNADGTRYRDWNLDFTIHQILPLNFRFLLPYDMTHLSKHMYFSGAYWVAKKSVMLEFPLNENKTWGEGEDVEWSRKFRNKYDFSMNINSTVHLMREKDKVFGYPNEKDLIELNKLK